MSVLDQIQEKSAAMNAKLNSLRMEMQAESKILMKEAFKDFFEKYGETVESIFWTQYTPYFNDGESCTFGVGDVWILLKNDEDACDYEGSYIDDAEGLDDLKADYKKLASFVSSIDEDLMEQMFGNHVKVIVSAEGIEIEEYDHE